ncbi:hypothetical protein D3C72_877970 [compost metagenome]
MNTLYITKYTLIAITFIFSLTQMSCSKRSDEAIVPDNQLPELSVIGQATLATEGIKAEILAENEFKQGYNVFYIKLTDLQTNKTIEKANISVNPMMSMKMDNGMIHKHSSPSIQPKSDNTTQGLVKGAFFFTMASTATGDWVIEVNATVANKQYQLTIPVTVSNNKYGEVIYKRTNTLKLADGSRIILSYMEPVKPKVGTNDLQLAIHTTNDMMTFSEAADFTVEMVTEMPSMGHGSPNNVNPVAISSGLYKGKVNFTMPGDWKLHFKLLKNGVAIAEDLPVELYF